MTDILSPRQRSALMSKVRSADTKPEWILRCGLHRLGFRYRVRDKQLPGRPDLVFRKYRSVIFVHGCYWHRHPGCRDASMPKSNAEFWARKFSENIERDTRVRRDLHDLGWRVLVVWECELVARTAETIAMVAAWLRQEDDRAEARYRYPAVNRGELLAVAEEKIRYRIDAYRAD